MWSARISFVPFQVKSVPDLTMVGISLFAVKEGKRYAQSVGRVIF
jgi:hypothetical protein